MEAKVGIFSKLQRKSSIKSSSSFSRWLGPGVTALGLLYVLHQLTFGGWSFSRLDEALNSDLAGDFRGEIISVGDRADRPANRIRVATFNIDDFAEEKSGTRINSSGVDVLGTIAKIVSTFDIVAIQELRGADGIALQRLVGLLNESGGNYVAIMSDPKGEEFQESYAFLWDQSRIRIVPGSDYVVQDNGGRMYRAPMVASFQCVVPDGSPLPPFRFTMINVHTKPDRVDPRVRESEINVLADVFQRVRQYEFTQHSEDDFVLLGDLNVDARNLGQLSTIPGVLSIAGDIQTEVTRSVTHDHILIDQTITAEYTGRRGVIDLQRQLGLTPQQAEAISDHLPVWAEFDLYERPPKVAVRAPAGGTRSQIFR
jgi:endonuclease/exonuclease/phosphatase family metal-dependent hydrolase